MGGQPLCVSENALVERPLIRRIELTGLINARGTAKCLSFAKWTRCSVGWDKIVKRLRGGEGRG